MAMGERNLIPVLLYLFRHVVNRLVETLCLAA